VAGWLSRSAFGLRPEERRPALLLFAYLFLVLTSYVATKSTRDALFLAQFGRNALPWADIASAVAVALTVSVYLRIGPRLRLPLLQSATLVVFALAAILFWWLGRRSDAVWHVPALYIWASVFGVLLPVQVWTLATQVVTTRQAKRLFGLVSSGAVSGWIAGGYLTRTVAPRAGADALLLTTAGALVVCIGLVWAIWRERRPDQGGATDAEASPSRAGLVSSFRLVRHSRYLSTIALLVGLSSLVTTIAAWQFRAVAFAAVPETDALTAFFGTFNFYAGTLSLATQLVVTPLLLRHAGLGPALLVVPLSLAGGSAALAASGALWAAVLLKGSDQVLRYAIDRPATELLYLPLSQHDTFVAKSVIDTVVLRLGDCLGSVVVLIGIAWLPAASVPRDLSVVALVLAGVWAATSASVRREYVTRLQTSIRRHRLDAERLQQAVLDRTAVQSLEQAMRSGAGDDLLYALDLLQGRDLEVPEGTIRRLEALLTDPDPAIRTEAFLNLTRLTDVDPLVRLGQLDTVHATSLQLALVAYLSREGPQQNLTAARVMLEAALSSGAALPETRLELVRALDLLPNEVFGEVSDAALPIVEDLFDEKHPPDIRRRAPDLLLRIGTPAAEQTLVEHLFDANPELRLQVVSALNKLRQRHPDRRLERELVETVLAAEILGHYRSYQILRRSPGADIDLAGELERIFRLLKLLYPDHDLQSAYVGARSENARMRDHALEFLEHTLPPRIRELLIPLLDRDVGPEERGALARRVVGETLELSQSGIIAVAAVVPSADAALREAADVARGRLDRSSKQS
jgi:AAA family ATP:ADP antiporter